MNEELQNALTELINKSMALGGDALAFTQEQLPDVIQQLLLWKGVVSAAGFGVSLALFIASPFMAKQLKHFNDSPKAQTSDFVGIVGAVLLIGAPIAMSLNLTWIQIWLAPKVYLLEYAANLAR